MHGTFLGGTTAVVTNFMIDDVRLDHCG